LRFSKALVATVVPWMVLIPPPVSSVGAVSAVLSPGLILRGNHAVGIATSMDVDVIAVAAPPTTNLVHQTIGVVGGSCAKLSSEGCSSDCDDYLEPPYPAGYELSSIVEVPDGRIRTMRTPDVTASERDIHPPLIGLAACNVRRPIHSFQDLILKGHAVRIAFLEPGLCGAGVGEDLEMVRVSDLFAGIHVDEHCH
jgi:hypothetical protein